MRKTKNNTNRRRWLSVLVLVVAVSLVAAACSSDDADSTTTTEAPSSTNGDTTTTNGDTTTTDGDTATTEPSGEPTSLVVAPPFPPESLDPHGPTSLDPGTRTVAKAIFDTLVTREGDVFVPSLAESWTNPDSTTWVFSIRSGVTFSDGSPLTAADVAASLERVIALEGPLAGSFSQVTGVTATDDLTLTITTEAPYGPLLGNLSLLYVGPASGIDEEGFWSAPIGTGPFVVESFAAGERVVTVANPGYWQGTPALDRLEFVWLPDEFARTTALETGEVDVTWRLSDDTLARLVEKDDIVVETVASFGSWVDWLNASNPPLDNKLVRQAMWHAVDWQQIIDDLFPLTATIATSAVSKSVFGYVPMEPYAYDPDLARDLLEQAGFPDGIETTAMFRDGQRLMSLAVISYWDEVGIKVEPLLKEHAVWLEDLLALNWDVNMMVQNAATGDADILLGRLYPCAAERTGYCNPLLDDALLDAKQSTDPADRLAAYETAISILWDEAPAMFPIDVLEAYAWGSGVSGFIPDPSAVPGWFTVNNSR